MSGVDAGASEQLREDDLAAKVLAARQALGLTQEALCERLNQRGLGWAQQTLWKVENCRRSIKATELYVLADSLGVDVRDFASPSDDFRRATLLARMRAAEAALEAATLECQQVAAELDAGGWGGWKP